jgi:hypothetical protein
MISESEIIELKKNTKFSLEPFGETINFSRDLEKLIIERAVERISTLDNGSGDEWDRAIRAAIEQLCTR